MCLAESDKGVTNYDNSFRLRTRLKWPYQHVDGQHGSNQDVKQDPKQRAGVGRDALQEVCLSESEQNLLATESQGRSLLHPLPAATYTSQRDLVLV